jgi:hypothetical protein
MGCSQTSRLNTRAIAHLDLSRTNNAALLQRLVYDEREKRTASDINLSRIAAQLVPLTLFGRNLDAITRASSPAP